MIADPTRGGDYGKYRGCSSMTPNRLEAGLATGRAIHTAHDALEVLLPAYKAEGLTPTPRLLVDSILQLNRDVR